MSVSRGVRLPLQVGVSALNNLVLGVLLVPLGLALAGLIAAFCYAALDVNDITFGLFVASLGVAATGMACLKRAWRSRPADVVFEADRLRVDGGDANGFAMGWSEIDPRSCSVAPLYDGEGEKQKQVGYALMVGTQTIAIADDEGDVDSLREVLKAIDARTSTPESAASVAVDAPAILACPTCGSPVAPSSEAAAPCGHCSAEVPMPEDVRARVAAAIVLPREARRAERIVERLLDQPGAHSTSVFLAGSLALIGGAWPVAIVTGATLFHAHALNLGKGLALAALPLGLIADGFFLSRLRLVDRRALATLALGFSAQPPTRAGAPPLCRACGAPLCNLATTIVRCIFCDAANLTGIDLRATAARVTLDAASLEDALEGRRAQRARWGFRTVASLPLFVGTVLLLRALW